MPKPTPREVGNPQPGFFKMRLVRGGPWVGAMIVHRGPKWQAVVDGCVTGESMNSHPSLNSQIMKIWTFARDVTPDEYHALTRAGRDVQPTQPVNLTSKESIF